MRNIDALLATTPRIFQIWERRMTNRNYPEEINGKKLTEEDAVFEFAKAWNRLQPDDFMKLLAPDARYASQWDFDEIIGVTAITDYLKEKMRTVRA